MKKNQTLIVLVILMSIAIIGMIVYLIWNSQRLDQIQQRTGQSIQNLSKPNNEKNCLGEECLKIENLKYPVGNLSNAVKDALDQAIEDEYKAHTVYEKVIDKLGSVRPFIMIVRAEEQHIASLKAIYDKYGITIPENQWENKIEVPGNLKESCQVGVDAEIANVALYRDKLIPAVKDYEDITTVFNNLMKASENNHLPSFEKCN